MRTRAWGPLCATLLLLGAGSARAFNVPKQTDYVTDTAGVLSPAELTDLNNRLGDYERKSTHQIFVLVTASLEGEPIEDVGYQLIQTWKPGQKGKDNGVVLVIATGERRIRIETGKGVGGDLTDLQANDIIRRRIVAADAREPGARRHPRRRRRHRRGALGHRHRRDGRRASARRTGSRPPVVLPGWFDLCFWGFILFVVVMLLLRASRHPRRRTYWGGPPWIGGGGGGWGGGGGGGWGRGRRRR